MHSTKKENPISADSPSILKSYWIASRPSTWIASISPVLIGTALALHQGEFSPPLFFLTLLFALFIQIGANFSNDYFDFVQGADTVDRKGPKRAVQQGWISPFSMWRAAYIAFGAALLFAIPLMLQAGLWSWGIAALCILLGILYTGGPKPLGYLGLGELLVFIFFGPVAVCGTYFLQTKSMSLSVFYASLSPAFLSTALLVANNLRDETSDRIANKKTLIVRWGKKFGSFEYTTLVVLAALTPCISGWSLWPSLILPLSIPCIRKSFQFKDPLELIPLLKSTSFLLLIYTLLFCISLW
jgi:1,4-dihydroxy-2-naphthoate octaprenyltransferase